MIDLNGMIEYSRDLQMLYVEDNEDVREMTIMILEDFFDSIVIAVDGEDGYEKFKSNKIDLVITDINMPKLNGLDMCSKIREIDAQVPIIVLSAYNEDDFFIKSIIVGVSGYLLKPIDYNQLLNLIYKIIKEYKYFTKTNLKEIIANVSDTFCDISSYSIDQLIINDQQIKKLDIDFSKGYYCFKPIEDKGI